MFSLTKFFKSKTETGCRLKTCLSSKKDNLRQPKFLIPPPMNSKESFVSSIALKALWCHVFLIPRINFPTTLLQYVNWHFWHFTGHGRRARYCSKIFVPAEHETSYCTRAITSRSLYIYIFYPIFQCGFYSKAVNIAE